MIEVDFTTHQISCCQAFSGTFFDIFDKLGLSLNGDKSLGPVFICGDIHEVAISAMITQG